MKLLRVFYAAAAALLMAWCLTQPALAESEAQQEQVPPAVKATILREAGDHNVLEVEEVRVGEALYYEADWLDAGMEIEVKVAPDGTLLSRVVEEPDDESPGDEEQDDGDAEGDD